jgi:polar amino acid transport system substrate-binding protein
MKKNNLLIYEYGRYGFICRGIMAAIFLITLLLLSVNGNCQTNGSMRIAGCEYPPYHCKGSVGLATELIDVICNAVNLKSEVVILPFRRRNHLFLKMELDAHSPGKVHLQGDDVKETETVVFYYANICLIYYTPNLQDNDLKTLGSFKDIRSLNHLRVGTIQKSGASSLFEKNGFNTDYAEDVPTLLKMLRKGRLDIISLIDITAMISISRLYDVAESVKFGMSEPILTIPLGIAFHKKHKQYGEMIGAFKKGLEIVKKDGSYIRVFEHYYGKENIPKNVLSEDMKSYGVNKTDMEKFMNHKRGACGEIIR